MIFFESIKLAFKSIWAHKIRSFLTIIGIVIGISSVVLLMSLGEGVKNDIKSMVNDLGSNLIFVISGNMGIKQDNQNNSSQMGFGSNMQFSNPANFTSGDILKQEDIDKIKQIDGVKEVAPMSTVSGFLEYEDKILSPTIMATTPQMKNILTGLNIDQGNFFEIKDNDEEKKVIVIGNLIAKNIFNEEENIIGKKIILSNQKDKYEFEIIGTLAKSTSASMFSSDLDSMVIIPYNTSYELFFDGKDKILRIGVKIDDQYPAKEAAKAIEDDMKTRHKEEEFSVMTQDDILGLLDDVLGMLTTFISAIAAISLLVGGVGIMNMMLTSVTERTREIGLRKAVGATNSNILLQFLIESIIISIFGGLVSLIFVQIGVMAIEKYSSLTPSITYWSIILAMSVCIGIGLVFGLAPAIQASKKDPIDALRYE